MSTGTDQAQYGLSAEYYLGGDFHRIVKPVPEVVVASIGVKQALAAQNIDDICEAVRDYYTTLQLPEETYDSVEQELRRMTLEKCIGAVTNACLDRPECDIGIQSAEGEILLPAGTHMVKVGLNQQKKKSDLVIKNSEGTSSVVTDHAELRARVVVGPEETISVATSHERLRIFSVFNNPKYKSVEIQMGDPAFAIYLKDAFEAGRNFAAPLLGDPSSYILKLQPNSTQVGHEHVHPHARVILVTEGEGILETGATDACADQKFSLYPGKTVYLTPGTWHRFSTGPTGLTVEPLHPVTPTAGASANSHEMFYGTWSNPQDLLDTIRRGAAR